MRRAQVTLTLGFQSRQPLRASSLVERSRLPTGSAPEEGWREAYARQEVRVTTNSFHAQVEAVRAGLGVAVLPEVLGEVLGLSALSLPAAVPPPPPLDMYVVVPRALRKVPRVAVVFDALVARLVKLEHGAGVHQRGGRRMGWGEGGVRGPPDQSSQAQRKRIVPPAAPPALPVWSHACWAVVVA